MFDYEAGGRYAEAVARYLDLFGRDRVRVMLFEEMFGADDARAPRARALPRHPLRRGPAAADERGRPGALALLAAVLDNDALRTRVKRLFPLPLRTRIGQAIRTSVPTEKPALDPGHRRRAAPALPGRHRPARGPPRPPAPGWPAG